MSQNLNRMTTRPLDVPRTTRLRGENTLTSLPAGKMVPLMAVELLREDALRSGRVRVNFEMLETAQLLMNAVYCDVKAYLVPWLAFERFAGSLDLFNRSYNGVALGEDPVVPFINTFVKGAHGAEAILKYMGKHGKPTANLNDMYIEAYNLIWNFRAQNRSPSIAKRLVTDKTLAPAFWRHENFAHIVPDFDQAVIDGEVALSVANAKMPVKGIGTLNTSSFATAGTNIRESGNLVASTGDWQQTVQAGPVAYGFIKEDPDRAGWPDVYAELQDNGITVSLSNIELARKTQAFARLREQYSEHDDEFIIDMLMSGLTIPDQSLKQPLLLGQFTNVFGQRIRYSSDADAMDASATNGLTGGALNLRVPRLSTGGVVMLVAEITPEQLFERTQDTLLHTTSVDTLPEYLRDELDPEKVEVVRNDYIDTAHATPAGTFGYGPLNHKFHKRQYNVGGKFYRPSTDGTADEVRQRIWSVEVANPTLSADFYLCTTMNQKPFLDTVADPFEAVAIGDFAIEGNTVFGGVLVEAMNNYDAVMEKAPVDRIEKP